jgi:hypothetical protein
MFSEICRSDFILGKDIVLLLLFFNVFLVAAMFHISYFSNPQFDDLDSQVTLVDRHGKVVLHHFSVVGNKVLLGSQIQMNKNLNLNLSYSEIKFLLKTQLKGS